MEPSIRFLFISCLIAATVATLLGLLAIVAPYWDLANHFRPFVLLGVILLMLLTFFMGFTRTGKFAAFLAVVNVILLLPALSNTGQTAPASVDETSAISIEPLTVLSFNVWVENEEIEDVIALIEERDASIVLLQEFYYEHALEMLPALKRQYPYVYSCGGEPTSCNLVIASKQPWSSIKHLGWSRDNAPLIDAVFKNNNEQDYHVIVTHIAWPFKPAKQQREMDWLASYVKNIKTPLILTGDMNLSPWSWKMLQFQSRTGLKRHTTFMHSWPAHELIPFVQLDHFLTSPQIPSLLVETGAGSGSDHLPVIATFSMNNL
ncbi:MAG: endonuclease/exonuclease/phosphatase family protein [Gammaproteobacteria bacterium]